MASAHDGRGESQPSKRCQRDQEHRLNHSVSSASNFDPPREKNIHERVMHKASVKKKVKRHRSASVSSNSTDTERSSLHRKKRKHSKSRSSWKAKRKRKYYSSTSDDSDSDNSDDLPSSKKSQIHFKTKEKVHKLKSKHKRYSKKDSKKKMKIEDSPSVSFTVVKGGSTSELQEAVALIGSKSAKPKGPLTREEYEKQQSVVRRVFDPDTGRHRLVKGDGEIVEEIVSRERQKAINKQATMGDGRSFQLGLTKLL